MLSNFYIRIFYAIFAVGNFQKLETFQTVKIKKKSK